MVRDSPGANGSSSFLPMMPSSGSLESLSYKSPPLEPGILKARQRKPSLTFADSILDHKTKSTNARSMVTERLTTLKAKQTPKVRKPLRMSGTIVVPPLEELDPDEEHAKVFKERRLSRQKVKEWEDKKKKLQPLKKKMSKPHLKPVGVVEPQKPSISLGGSMMLLLALSKFKIAGDKTHKGFLDKKEKEKQAKLAKKHLQETLQIQQAEELTHKLEDEAMHNKVGVLIGKERLAHEKLMNETQVLRAITPHRPEDPTHKFIQGDGTVRPNSAEAWELGIDLLKLQDKLNAIGPGSQDPVMLAPKATNYPSHRPKMNHAEIRDMLDDEITKSLKVELNNEKRKLFNERKSKSVFDVAMRSVDSSKVQAKMKANAAKMNVSGGKKSFRNLLGK